MKIQWTFKDGSRRYWRVVAWTTGEKTPVEGMAEDFDLQWAYEISWENNEEPIYRGYVIGQTDQPPHLQTLLLDWLQDITAAVVDGCVNHKQEMF